MRLFDSHAHLTDRQFGAELPQVLTRAADVGVAAIVTIASDLRDAGEAAELARGSSHPRVWATAGIHPHEAEACGPEELAQLERLAQSQEIVAIGETGLDFHYENAPQAAQKEAFHSQLELAERLNLPVVVHCRSADTEMAEIVSEYAGRVTGVLHCFTGGEGLLEAGLAAGWYISFSGIVTFRKYQDESRVREVPEDRLLVETDSPYLAPVPRRGRRNEPSYVAHVARRVAELRGEDFAKVAQTTYTNACRFYRLQKDD